MISLSAVGLFNSSSDPADSRPPPVGMAACPAMFAPDSTMAGGEVAVGLAEEADE